MVVPGEELRQHARFRVPLKVVVDLPAEEITTTTVGISRAGMSVRLSPPPAIDEAVPIAIHLPDGRVVLGRARCRAHMPGCLCGMSLELEGKSQAVWDSFLDEEESTGSLWRMIGRIAAAPDDAWAPRGIVEQKPDVEGGAQLRFHTTGENGLAYRIAFQKHPSDPAEESDLCVKLPGFREPARRLVRRVLREDFTFRFDEGATEKIVRGRVVELIRGGWAWVQGDETTPVGFVALGVGELVLVEKNGVSVFPHFTPLELEQIACDTFRNDLSRPMFRRPAPPPVPLPTLPSAPEPTPRAVDPRRFKEGYDAVRFAQAVAEDVQKRRYGDRDIYFHPSVWAKVRLDDGTEVMGPTMQDGARVCLLALVGAGAPRVIRLNEQSAVSLLKPPSR